MKRSILLGFVAPMVFAGVVEAKPPSHSCFVQMGEKTTDLSISLCRNTPMKESEIAANFLAELRWKVAYGPRGESASDHVSKNPQPFVEWAKAYCMVRKQGATDAQIFQAQRRSMPKWNAEVRSAVTALQKTTNQLSVKHFCPELL